MTRIEWANPPSYKGESWNPVTGCSPVSPGCDNCWARAMAHRFPGRFGDQADPFKPATLYPRRLRTPCGWRKCRCIFVCSMGDLFHDDVSDGVIQNVLDIVDECPQHRFLLLTKRPDRTCETLNERYNDGSAKNLAVGVSVEDQQRADERIPLLLQCSAAMRFVSVEPMLGPVDLENIGEKSAVAYRMVGLEPRRLDWVIIGCESGPKRRECDWTWINELLIQCRDAGVPAFVKQYPVKGRVSHDPAEWPVWARVRQWPKFLQETPDA